MQAEMGVIYTEKQWMVIQRIYEYLQEPKPIDEVVVVVGAAAVAA